MPKYQIHVEFEAVGLNVTAKNAKAAKAKVRKMYRLGRKRPRIDKNNFFASNIN